MSFNPELLQNQPVDTAALPEMHRNGLVVSLVRVLGRWTVLSRYGDSTWDLVPTTTNKLASDLRIRFKNLPDEFDQQVRAMTYRYMRRGRANGRWPP